jgi:hypothetical protein
MDKRLFPSNSILMSSVPFFTNQYTLNFSTAVIPVQSMKCEKAFSSAAPVLKFASDGFIISSRLVTLSKGAIQVLVVGR